MDQEPETAQKMSERPLGLEAQGSTVQTREFRARPSRIRFTRLEKLHREKRRGVLQKIGSAYCLAEESLSCCESDLHGHTKHESGLASQFQPLPRVQCIRIFKQMRIRLEQLPDTLRSSINTDRDFLQRVSSANNVDIP